MAKLDLSPLPKAEVIKAVERKNPARVPLVMNKWWGEGLPEQYGSRLDEWHAYPCDAYLALFPTLRVEEMGLSWYDPSAVVAGHDARVVIPDFKHLDEFIARLPDPQSPTLFDRNAHPSLDTSFEITKNMIVGDYHRGVQRAKKEDRYLLFGWWNLFFERPWSLRGMENLMMDYYLYPEETHRLNDAMCTLYEGYLERLAHDFAPDGFFSSDDLGNQRQLMMRPEHFREFLLPYYRRIGAACRKHKMHFWLHSCGNNSEILDDLIDAGLTVFHPVQKHTMDRTETARRFGDRLTFMAGVDVQQTMQTGTPDDVRQDVRELVDTFDRPDGRLILAAGNSIVAGTPYENLTAYMNETVRYAAEHRRIMRG